MTTADQCQLAMETCAALRDEALAQRLCLLHSGWGDDHPLCQQFDDVARHWATAWEAWRRLRLRLEAADQPEAAS